MSQCIDKNILKRSCLRLTEFVDSEQYVDVDEYRSDLSEDLNGDIRDEFMNLRAIINVLFFDSRCNNTDSTDYCLKVFELLIDSSLDYDYQYFCSKEGEIDSFQQVVSMLKQN